MILANEVRASEAHAPSGAESPDPDCTGSDGMSGSVADRGFYVRNPFHLVRFEAHADAEHAIRNSRCD